MFKRLLRSLYIQVKNTPNEHALKFLPGTLVNAQAPLEILDQAQAAQHSSRLAQQLLAIEGVRSVFFGRDFISVNKQEDSHWKHLKPQILAAITDHISNKQVILENQHQNIKEIENDNDSPTVKEIKKILDTKIRPAVQSDGGDVEYCGFVDGWVRLQLRGACRSCSSSVVTLRNGIENMLMYYIPQVKGIEQVEDEASQQEFIKLEKELAAKKKK